MTGRPDQRQGKRIRTVLTALIRPPAVPAAALLRVINLSHGGALCRSQAAIPLGATFHAEFVLDGPAADRQPRVLRAFCRVIWSAGRTGPSRPVQEIGLSFVEMADSDRAHLASLLSSVEAA